MDAGDVVATYRATDEGSRTDFVAEAYEADPSLPRLLVHWAAQADGVEEGDHWLFADLAELVEEPAARAEVRVAEAEVRWMTGDSVQYVLETAVEAISTDADLPRPYEIFYELMVNHSDLVWEDALERIDGSAPPDAKALLLHLVQRSEKRGQGAPWSLSFAPAAGHAAALQAAGQLAEALAARRLEHGEDFPTARRAIFAG
jgi:hypothetical protein